PSGPAASATDPRDGRLLLVAVRRRRIRAQAETALGTPPHDSRPPTPGEGFIAFTRVIPDPTDVAADEATAALAQIQDGLDRLGRAIEGLGTTHRISFARTPRCETRSIKSARRNARRGPRTAGLTRARRFCFRGPFPGVPCSRLAP